MTTKPTVLCPKCHEPIDLEQGGRCANCGTELKPAEQPGVGTPGPDKPQE